MATEELKPVHVLVVDDEEAICWSLRRALVEEGYIVEIASSAEQGIELALRTTPDVIVMDVRLPGMDGLTAIGKLRQMKVTSPVVLITAFGDLATAVEAAKQEVAEYLTKPFDLAIAVDAVARTVRRRRGDAARKGNAAPASSQPGELIGSSQVMQGVFRQRFLSPRQRCQSSSLVSTELAKN
ncbi:MAG: response regulator [Pirellulales bacterium]